MESLPTRRRIRHLWWIAAVVLGGVVAAGIALVSTVVPLSSEAARVRLVAALSDRLQGEVELRELHLRVFPSLKAEGSGLTIRHHGRHDVPPLISIDHFAAEGSITSLLHKHISRLTLDGLDIEIPPDRNRSVDRKNEDSDEGEAGPPSHGSNAARTLVIDELRSVRARLAIIPAEADRGPKVWNIHDLRMTSVSTDIAMPFQATLTNAVPPGEITTSGTFGPWQSPEPGTTPLDGTFVFDNADLSVFNGISGILASHGTFGGMLARIDVHGQTETPDFVVKTGGHPVPLHTQYHAIVDGTNGNTILEHIDASFLKTAIVAKGAVVGKPGKEGRTTTLDVTIDKGRLEDVLMLAVKTKTSPMVGALRLSTKFVLPPGNQDVVKKLRLNGRFAIADGRFTNLDVQGKINQLSRRSRGQEPSKAGAKVASRFTGAFRLGGGTLTIPEVTFDVPGAGVRLAGTYNLVPETLDFRGTLFTDAKVSQMVKGYKSILLKVIDPLFRREGGGAAIPIKISGRRDSPSFGLDKGRVFSRNKNDTKS
jgi:hypothetical protein